MEYIFMDLIVGDLTVGVFNKFSLEGRSLIFSNSVVNIKIFAQKIY